VQWTAPPGRDRGLLEAPAPEGAALAADAGLEPYTGAFDRRRAQHLLRRTSFGADPAAVTALLQYGSAGAAVDAIVDAATLASTPPLPTWYHQTLPPPEAPQAVVDAYIQANIDHIYEAHRTVFREMLALRASGTAFRERMALVWSNHLVTGVGTYFHAPWLARYWRLLRQHALGDFRAMVSDVGLTPAMLVYLNGYQNQAGSPNENYARELLELFTMGITGPDGTPNYSQTDVTELARALTGWSFDVYGTQNPVFVAPWHDGGAKTILGRTGPWGYADVGPILFEERGAQIAHFVCRKLYRALVYAVPNEAIVGELAAEFRASGFQIAPVVRRILKSAHFFSDAALGAQIKSPVEAYLGFQREAGLAESDELYDLIWYVSVVSGMQLFEPPNVAGWPGHRHWVDTGTLAYRWAFSEWLVYQQPERLPALARRMASPYNAAALTSQLAAFLLSAPLDAAALARATDVLLDGLPAYEWTPDDPGAQWRLAALLLHLMRLPEFQLT
jgi:uncharacterized protein (DUF1800 family)